MIVYIESLMNSRTVVVVEIYIKFIKAVEDGLLMAVQLTSATHESSSSASSSLYHVGNVIKLMENAGELSTPRD